MASSGKFSPLENAHVICIWTENKEKKSHNSTVHRNTTDASVQQND